jgi:hypothetical protein
MITVLFGYGARHINWVTCMRRTLRELVRRNVMMDDVISDLEKVIEDNPDHVAYPSARRCSA